MITVESQANYYIANRSVHSFSVDEYHSSPDFFRPDDAPKWVHDKHSLSKMIKHGVPIKEVVEIAKAMGFKEPFLSRISMKTYHTEFSSKLNLEIAEQIRKEGKTKSGLELAKKYNVSTASIYRILNGKSYTK